MTRQPYRTSLPPALTPAERMARKQQQKAQREAKPPKPTPAEQIANKLAGLRYDYGQIDEADRETVQRAALAILAHGRRAKESIVSMGQELIDVKAILPEWTFTAWLKTEFELSERMAQNMMNVARQYGERPEIISVLNDTVLYLLSAPSTPESARVEVEQIAITEGRSPKVARAQHVVKTHKAAPEPIQHDETPEIISVLSFADWLAIMPTDLALREQMAILTLAKATALRALGDHPKLYNAVYGALPTWSALIHEIEKRLKTDDRE